MDRDDLRFVCETLGLAVLWLIGTALEIVLLTLAIYACGHWILGVW